MSAEIQTLHIPFRQWLDRTGQPYTYHRPDKPTGGTLGDADFLIHRDGRCLHIEFKDVETRISKVQQIRHTELLQAGCRVHVCRDVASAVMLTETWRATLDGGERDITAARTECTIQQRGEDGDWIHDGRGWLRRAVVDDYKVYRRAGK